VPPIQRPRRRSAIWDLFKGCTLAVYKWGPSSQSAGSFIRVGFLDLFGASPDGSFRTSRFVGCKCEFLCYIFRQRNLNALVHHFSYRPVGARRLVWSLPIPRPAGADPGWWTSGGQNSLLTDLTTKSQRMYFCVWDHRTNTPALKWITAGIHKFRKKIPPSKSRKFERVVGGFVPMAYDPPAVSRAWAKLTLIVLCKQITVFKFKPKLTVQWNNVTLTIRLQCCKVKSKFQSKMPSGCGWKSRAWIQLLLKWNTTNAIIQLLIKQQC
jgi:hypothetical protein